MKGTLATTLCNNGCTDDYRACISTQSASFSSFVKGSETSDQHIRQICRAMLEGKLVMYVVKFVDVGFYRVSLVKEMHKLSHSYHNE